MTSSKLPPKTPMPDDAPQRPLLRIALILLAVLILDQCTKHLVQQFLKLDDQYILLDGFFRLVHWGNTGAAMNLFPDSNTFLAALASVAFFVLLFNHTWFQSHRKAGQAALGLMLGGILGNLADRLRTGHVVDFIYFYAYQRDGGEVGFPAFNIADSAIFSGVCLFILINWEASPRDKA